MKKNLLITLGVLVIGGAMIQAVVYAQGNAAQGQTLYEDNCLICHGPKGEGNGPAAAALNPKPFNFTQKKFWATTSDKQIAAIIQSGKGAMPAFQFSSEQIEAIINYLHQAFKPATSS